MPRRLLLIAFAALAALVVLPTAPAPAQSGAAVTVFPWGRRYTSPGPHEVYVLGEPPAAPRRTALFLYQQGDKSLTTAGVPSYEFAQALLAGLPPQQAQWTICSVAVPSHQLPDIWRDGKALIEPVTAPEWVPPDTPGAGTSPLWGWPWRYANGHTLWDLGFFDRVNTGLLNLRDAGYTDLRKVAVVGFSRGGFCAFHVGARNPLIKWIVGINPVTRLRDLKPWMLNHPNPAALDQEDVAHLAPLLTGKRTLITVNGFDTTVSTKAAIETWQALFDAGNPTDTLVPDHTLVVPGNPGHRTPWRTYPRIIDWMNLRADAVLDPPP
jgi:hypothetical protein